MREFIKRHFKELEKYFSSIREAPGNKKSAFLASGEPPQTRKVLFYLQGSPRRQEKYFSSFRRVPADKKSAFLASGEPPGIRKALFLFMADVIAAFFLSVYSSKQPLSTLQSLPKKPETFTPRIPSFSISTPKISKSGYPVMPEI